jgi:hypothetical protein
MATRKIKLNNIQLKNRGKTRKIQRGGVINKRNISRPKPFGESSTNGKRNAHLSRVNLTSLLRAQNIANRASAKAAQEMLNRLKKGVVIRPATKEGNLQFVTGKTTTNSQSLSSLVNKAQMAQLDRQAVQNELYSRIGQSESAGTFIQPTGKNPTRAIKLNAISRARKARQFDGFSLGSTPVPIRRAPPPPGAPAAPAPAAPAAAPAAPAVPAAPVVLTPRRPASAAPLPPAAPAAALNPGRPAVLKLRRTAPPPPAKALFRKPSKLIHTRPSI